MSPSTTIPSFATITTFAATTFWPYTEATPTTFPAPTDWPTAEPLPTSFPPGSYVPGFVEYNQIYQHARLTDGKIAGIVVGTAAIVMLVPTIGYVCYRRYRNKTTAGGWVPPTTSTPNKIGLLGKLLGKRAKKTDEEKVIEGGGDVTSANWAHGQGDTVLPNTYQADSYGGSRGSSHPTSH